MKLEMTLPSRPGLMYALPGVDILALILILPLLGSSFRSNTGIEITLAESMHRIAPLDRSVQVSIKGVVKPRIWVNKREVKEEDLLEAIANATSSKKKPAIALQVDKRVPSGYKQRIQEMLLLKHYLVFDMRTPAMK